jgi:hypothetical protein
MDGVLDELLRLEDVKHQALINLDPVNYHRSVQDQIALLEDSRLSEEVAAGTEKLHNLSRLARINGILYLNLLSTAPWLDTLSRAYGDNGQMTDSSVPGRFTVEA